MLKITELNLNLKASILLIVFLTLSCDSGKLKVLADLPTSLPEISAVEKFPNSDVLWVIQDAGNNNHVYGLNTDGKIIRDITITNAKNEDWEDLTIDNENNLYIGDFGNNDEKRKQFEIYKINPSSETTKVTAEVISFELPKKQKPKDFEAFVLHNGFFYIFSKETKKFITLKVPNKPGKHIAEILEEFNLEGKNNRITSAVISSNGLHLYLLNHDKVWEVSNFNWDAIFKGTIKSHTFNHDSQKEGVCIKNSNTLYITDEFKKNEGGNLYEFTLQ
ncbi:SdiA-regulated domain-containing protein [Hanstruepera marina]|uniref:SdiA-regulated domain-containing protein n=1 Tax=Hanstruepera marina TaxID=2873265 RepID=UPI001CA74F47|nr:SdiA-regulated domain-containing protein [Hanstruepera marina]